MAIAGRVLSTGLCRQEKPWENMGKVGETMINRIFFGAYSQTTYMAGDEQQHGCVVKQ